MRIRLTRDGDQVFVLVDGKPQGYIPLTPELNELLGSRSRVFDGTFENGVLTLGDEHAPEVD